MRLLAVCAAAALSLCACGNSGKLTCTDDAACGDGRRCARTVPGESHGVCVADYQLAFRSPADQALLTAGSVPVSVDLTLGSADQPAPQTVDLFVDGTFAQVLNLTARTGSVASYGGVVTLGDGQTVSLEVVAARGTMDEVRAGPVRVTVQSIKPPPPPGGGGGGGVGGGGGGGGGGGVPPNPPRVASSSLTCLSAQACMRDEVVAVSATVENGPSSVRVWTDLAPGKYYPLTNGTGGTSYTGTIPLAAVPFPMFTAGVNATVEALDASGAVVSPMRRGMTVTRLRWAYAAGVAVTSPAVMDDGTLVVGLAKGSSQLVGVKPDGSQAWAATLEAKAGTGGFVTSAPAVGKKAIWVGSDDGRLYAVSLDGSGLVANGVCPDASTSVTAGHVFTPLVYQLPSSTSGIHDEEAFTGGSASSSYLGMDPWAASPCHAAIIGGTSEFSRLPMIMTKDGISFLTTYDSDVDRYYATFSKPKDDTPGELDVMDWFWSRTSIADLAADSAGGVIIGISDGATDEVVHKKDLTSWSIRWAADPNGVQFPAGSMVVAADDGPLVGGKWGKVDRLSSAGEDVSNWPISFDTAGEDVTGLALAVADASRPAIYATSSSGDLFALDQSGLVVWSTRSGSTQLLGTGKLDFPTIAPAVSDQTLPTLYAGSADGHLYAVVVDSGLDPASPWPKAHHDVRNTGNGMAVRP